jgi:hypothetical protein
MYCFRLTTILFSVVTSCCGRIFMDGAHLCRAGAPWRVWLPAGRSLLDEHGESRAGPEWSDAWAGHRCSHDSSGGPAGRKGPVTDGHQPRAYRRSGPVLPRSRRQVDQRIALAATRPAFGGQRWWFIDDGRRVAL